MQRAAQKSIPRGHRTVVKRFWTKEIEEATKANNEARGKYHEPEGDAIYYKST